MSKLYFFLQLNQKWIWGILITLLGFIIRYYHYDSLPPFNWTSDEFAFAWSGMSLIQDGVPTSWSFLSTADDFLVVVWENTGVRYRLVTPWFDHPPLFGLIVGGAAILGGAKEFFDCSLSVIRIPSLMIGTLSVFLVYWLGLHLANTYVAVLASLIFATNPNTVFLSRLAVSENLLLCLSLGVTLLFLNYLNTSLKKYLYLAAVLAGLATLVKVTGLFMIATLIALLLFKNQWKNSIIVAAIGLGFFCLYFVYGWIYDFSWFLVTLKEHSSRFEDFAILKNLALPTVFFEDGWLILSWLSLLLVSRSFPESFKLKLIVLPILIYTILLICSGAQSHWYAWYTIPYYPFLFLVLGIFLNDFRQKPDFITACLIFMFTVVWMINLNIKDWLLASPYGRSYFILATGLILGVFFLNDIATFKPKTLNKLAILITTLIFLGLIAGNLNVIYNYQLPGW